jgi:serine palmitoyltransferase
MMELLDASKMIMPNLYTLGFKTGEAIQRYFVLQETRSSSNSSDDDTNATVNVIDYSVSLAISAWTIMWQLFDGIKSFPALYSSWWLDLVQNDPLHVLVETTLAISILYILFARSKDWQHQRGGVVDQEKLTSKEEEELLLEWKLHGRAPLTPPLDPSLEDEESYYHKQDIIVHRVKGATMEISISSPNDNSNNTNNITSNNNNNNKIGKQQQQQQRKKKIPNATTTTNTQTVLNFATFDFLGMGGGGSGNDDDYHQEFKHAAERALDKYGCGSCGPRGFYGTIDAHLQLERVFADFLQTDGAILYSDGASTCSSTIAAFAKRGDLLICDAALYEPLKTGIALSRAHVKTFAHNDMKDLRRVLEKVRANDAKVGRKPNAQRRFIVVEGLYKNTGSIVPLDQVVALKHEFSYRLILDESHSFGALGKTGRGVVELYNQRLMQDVEITTIGLETSMGSIGGITVGTDEVVDHQRLSGSGYCFSASSPPFTAMCAVQALQLLQTRPEILQQLQDNRVYLHYKLTELCHGPLEDVLQVTSHEESPIVFLKVADIPETRELDELVFLREVVRESLLRGVAFCVTTASSSSTTTSTVSTAEGSATAPAPTTKADSSPGIRITVSAAQTHQDIDQALTVLSESVDVVMSRFHEEMM